MAGTFILGETKVRPGTYFNIQKKGGNAAAGVMNGVTAVNLPCRFRSSQRGNRVICRGWLRRNIRYRTYYGRNERGNRRWRKDDHRLQSR